MNKIFISYKNEEPDKTIALKLYEALNSLYFPVFLDKNRLDAGTKWNEQLRENVKNSESLLVVWSSKSRQSDWVLDEIANFRNNGADGLFFFVCLDDEPDAYKEYQLLMDFKLAGIYPDKIGTMDSNLLDAVVNKVRASIYKKAKSEPIARAVFTMTVDGLETASLSADKKAEIQNNYGKRYADWKPFGSKRTIEVILDELLYADINRGTEGGKVSFHWEDIDWQEATSNLWLPAKDANNNFIDANTKATTGEINKLEKAACVLILDPYALNDGNVKDRFMRAYNKCMMNSRAVIMALDSYPLSAQLSQLRQQLQNDAESFYESYFEPNLIEKARLAECFANTIDDKEVKRNLRVTFKNIIGETLREKTATNAYLNGQFGS